MGASVRKARKATTLRAPVPPPAAAGAQPPTPHDHLRMAGWVVGHGGRGHRGRGGCPLGAHWSATPTTPLKSILSF